MTKQTPLRLRVEKKAVGNFRVRYSSPPITMHHQPRMLLGLTLAVLSFLHFSVNAATVCNAHSEVCQYCTGPTPQVSEVHDNSSAIGVMVT